MLDILRNLESCSKVVVTSNRNVDHNVQRTSSGVDKITFVQRYLATFSQRRFVSWVVPVDFV